MVTTENEPQSHSKSGKVRIAKLRLRMMSFVYAWSFYILLKVSMLYYIPAGRKPVILGHDAANKGGW